MAPIKNSAAQFLDVPTWAIPVTRNQTALLRKYETWREAFQETKDISEACKGLIFVTNNPAILTRNRCSFIKSDDLFGESKWLQQPSERNDQHSLTNIYRDGSASHQIGNVPGNPNLWTYKNRMLPREGFTKMVAQRSEPISEASANLIKEEKDNRVKKCNDRICKTTVNKARKRHPLANKRLVEGTCSPDNCQQEPFQNYVTRRSFTGMVFDRLFNGMLLLMYPIINVLERTVNICTAFWPKSKSNCD